MLEQTVLLTKNPDDFKVRNYNVTFRGITYNISPIGDDLSFDDVTKQRKPIDPKTIKRNLRGDGHVFSNLGVGTFLTITLDGKNYVIGGKQIRSEQYDEVFVAPGGYVESRDSFNPLRALNREISEEVLVVTKDNKLIPIGRNDFKPYEAKLRFLEKIIDLENPGELTQDNLQEPVLLDGGLLLKKPRLYFDSFRNTAKLMYSFHMSTDETDLQSLEISLQHCEDKFNTQTNKIQSVCYQDKLLLIPINRGKLEQEVCRFQDGKLKPLPDEEIQNLYLSGVFTLDENGFSTKPRIKFTDYLENQ